MISNKKIKLRYCICTTFWRRIEDGTMDVATKKKLAQIVREHYKKHPQALSMQASGNSISSTVANDTK